MIALTDTIAQGKQWLLARVDKGEHCPLCGQHAKLYRRKITSGMAASLISMYGQTRQDWIHVTSIKSRSRDHAMLAYWGLIEEMPAQGPHGGRAGYWRVTDRGCNFLKNRLTVPKYAKVYDGRVLGFDGPGVVIRDALGTKFNYDDLMKGI